MKFILRQVKTFFFVLSLFFQISLFSSCFRVKEPSPILISTLFSSPAQVNMHISPSGKFISYLKPYLGRMNLFIMELATRKETKITQDKDNDINRYKWGNEDKLFYLRDSNKDENFHLYLVDCKGGKSRDLTPYSKVRVDWWEDDGRGHNQIFFAMNRRNPEVQDLYRYNLTTHVIELVYCNIVNNQLIGIKQDNQGILRLIITSNGIDHFFLYRNRSCEKFRKTMVINFKDRLNPISFDMDNKSLYVSSNIGRDKLAIIKIDPSTGKELKTIYQNPQYDVTEFYYSPSRKRAIYALYNDWKNRIVVLDSTASKSFKLITERFPNLEIRVMDMDSSETFFVLRFFNDRNLGYYYLFNRFSKSLVKLSDLSPWIPTSEMRPMMPIQIKTRDQLLLNGYLTLPAIQEKRKLPLIVSIHNGPIARNTWIFDRETQFFASRGYAVLQINYRGSSGYGKEFYKAGFKQWGRKIQNDITDATLWAIKEGIADSNRVALFGFGFGGYCALMGAVLKPHLYACVISYSGISNVFDYIKDVPPLYKVISNRLYETIGNPEKDLATIKDISPCFHVSQFSVPVFIAQGGKDNRVNINETDYFVRELRKKGVNVTYFVRSQEGSVFTKVEDKKEFYSQLETFLAQNLKNH